ncbi:MAG: low molecular weight protein arginine phosphatase [Anaerolineae bacterium]|nr:low molecular weight protein arginine phosphatase [Anaerolineae bacterium]
MIGQDTILLVCTGNVSRSPMAAAILEDLLREDSRNTEFVVRSAGTWTRDGLAASPLAVEAMAERGLDISTHRSHHLSPQDVEQAILIITMTRDQKQALLAEFHQAANKIYLLSELAGERHDIADPSGSDSLTTHRECAREIGRLLRSGYPCLVGLVSGQGRSSPGVRPSGDATDASTSPTRSRP